MSALASLTPQQRAFCEQYIANGRNGTQAAIAAGYGVKSAHVRASKLLAKDAVQLALAELVLPAAAKAIDEVGKKAAALQVREESVTAREEAVAVEESIEALRERIKRRMVESLCGMAFTRFDQLATWTERGIEFMPSAELTPEALEAIEAMESDTTELELAEGTKLGIRTKLKVKRHDRLRAMKQLEELLEINPPKERGRGDGPLTGVMIVVAGGRTGLELGAIQGAQVAIVQAPAADSPEGATGHASSAVPPVVVPAPPGTGAKALRPWNPGPKKGAAAPARAIVSKPTGQ